ncbi:MAG TPA: MarP family serine protease [Acidimicrobiales bacterium]|nr:MarP family serine protease [Acidimicrobiales bacterium]
MNALDLLVVLAALGAALAGSRLGFATRVGSWIGLAVGLVAGVRVLPWVLARVQGGGRAVMVPVAGLVVLGSAALGQSLGFALSQRFVPRPRRRPAVVADRALGALAGVVGLAALVWLALPLLAQVPGWPADQTASSRVARVFAEDLPTAPDAARIAEALLGPRGFPQVLDDLAPPGSVSPPPSSGLRAATAEVAARSVVEVQGIACQRVLDGTGFVVGADLVATNAHVVAGEATTTVFRDDGAARRAVVVAYDPERDLALLSVPGIDRPALVLSAPTVGERGGVFGHPGGAPLRIAPFEITSRITATGPDIYGAHATTRDVLQLAAALEPGDSGSPLVDRTGRVVGVAFASATDVPRLAYALAPSELGGLLASPRAGRVSTGTCSA